MLFRIASALGWSIEQIYQDMSAAELAKWHAWFLVCYWQQNPQAAPPVDSDDPEEHSRLIDSIF